MSVNDCAKSAVDALNTACEKKSYQSFKDLPIGEYIVNHFSICNTTYGDRVRIELVDTYMILPERFVTKLDQEKIDVLNRSPKIMVYGGKDSTSRERLILEFRDSSYYADMFTFETA